MEWGYVGHREGVGQGGCRVAWGGMWGGGDVWHREGVGRGVTVGHEGMLWVASHAMGPTLCVRSNTVSPVLWVCPTLWVPCYGSRALGLLLWVRSHAMGPVLCVCPTSRRIPLLLPPGPARQWLQTRHLGVRPWGSFLDPQRFGAPRGLGDVGQRLRRNGAHFQSNYLCVGLGIGLYGL